jgi:hypothetical protein
LIAIRQVLTRYSANDPQFPVNDGLPLAVSVMDKPFRTLRRVDSFAFARNRHTIVIQAS